MRLTLREFFLFRDDYEAEQLEKDIRAYNIAAPIMAIARGLGGGKDSEPIDPANLFPRLRRKKAETLDGDRDEEEALALTTKSWMESLGSR